jgi:hypothetical protein
MKLFLIPMKNKSAFEKSYGQRPCGCRMERLIRNNPLGRFHRNKTTKVSENPLLTGWVQMEAATEKVEETSTKVIELSNQGTTGAGHQFLRFLETTLTVSIGERAEQSQSTGKLGYPTGSLVLQTDFFRCNYLTSSSLPTIPSMMAKSNQSSSLKSILNQSSWPAGTMTSKHSFFPWH